MLPLCTLGTCLNLYEFSSVATFLQGVLFAESVGSHSTTWDEEIPLQDQCFPVNTGKCFVLHASQRSAMWLSLTTGREGGGV